MSPASCPSVGTVQILLTEGSGQSPLVMIQNSPLNIVQNVRWPTAGSCPFHRMKLQRLLAQLRSLMVAVGVPTRLIPHLVDS